MIPSPPASSLTLVLPHVALRAWHASPLGNCNNLFNGNYLLICLPYPTYAIIKHIDTPIISYLI